MSHQGKDPTLLLTEIEQISGDQVQRNLFGHKSGSIFPKPLCGVSVREGESEKQGRHC